MPVRNEVDVAEELQLNDRILEMREGQDHLAEQQADEADRGMEIRRFDDVATAMKIIMEGNAAELDIESIEGLSRDERAALDLLAEVVRGRHHDGNKFYAEYRLVGLNNVLAVLQPILAVGTLPGFEQLRDTFHEVVDLVNDLRDMLDTVDAAEAAPIGLEFEEVEDEDEDDEDDDDDEGDEGDEADEADGAASSELSDDLAANRRRRAPRTPGDTAGDDDDEPADE